MRDPHTWGQQKTSDCTGLQMLAPCMHFFAFKSTLHMRKDHFSWFTQSYHCFLALSLQLSYLKHPLIDDERGYSSHCYIFPQKHKINTLSCKAACIRKQSSISKHCKCIMNSLKDPESDPSEDKIKNKQMTPA